MEDNEKLKALVLARAGEICQEFFAQLQRKALSNDTFYVSGMLLGEFVMMQDGDFWRLENGTDTIRYTFVEWLPASDPVWALVAPILGIQIEE